MTESQYDAIIIGSGAGGAAAAYRLALAGLNVLMLEKGDYLPKDGSTLSTQRVVHERGFLSREGWIDADGHVLTPEEHFNVGGKTKWYGAALLRPAEHEFLPDTAYGCPGWPLGLPELVPYYHQAEILLGVRTFDREPGLTRILSKINESWLSQPIALSLAGNISQNRIEASHFDGFASVAGLKGEAETSIIELLRTRPNFALLRNAEVHTLCGSADSTATITGVRLQNGREILAPRVFLAAGALHSPRLLARYLAASNLESILPAAAHIGRNLKLHLLTAMVALSTRPVTDLIRKTVLITNEEFPHSSVQPLGFDAELIATLVPKVVPRSLRAAIGLHSYGFFLQTEDGSDARNRVHESETDLQPSTMDYDESRLPQARREHKQFVRAFRRALLGARLLSFTQRIGLNGTAHVCGTLVCGHDPKNSVVDANGRVHGMNGLYVVDGSVLPRSTRVNPSLTIYAWALRVGDLVSRNFQNR
jgi:choline dehydrogenase-like flavoprotein